MGLRELPRNHPSLSFPNSSIINPKVFCLYSVQKVSKWCYFLSLLILNIYYPSLDSWGITHQLQLVFVAIANKHIEIETFFDLIDRVVNVVGGSAKQCDLLRKKQRLQILKALNHGEISSGQCLN